MMTLICQRKGDTDLPGNILLHKVVLCVKNLPRQIAAHFHNAHIIFCSFFLKLFALSAVESIVLQAVLSIIQRLYSC